MGRMETHCFQLLTFSFLKLQRLWSVWRCHSNPAGEGLVLGCYGIVCVCSVAQLCLTLCDPMDCSPPGSSVHGILWARILEWVAISFSRRSSRPRDLGLLNLLHWQVDSLPLVPPAMALLRKIFHILTGRQLSWVDWWWTLGYWWSA